MLFWRGLVYKKYILDRFEDMAPAGIIKGAQVIIK